MTILFLIIILSLFLEGCSSDNLSMASRFYGGNTYSVDSVASGLSAITRAKKQYADDKNKLSISYLLEALLLTKAGSDKLQITSAYKQSLKSNPTNLTAAINLSNLYYDANDTKEAIIYYKLALSLVNKDIEATTLKKFPKTHIMNDIHMKIFLRNHKFNNPYFYEGWSDTVSGNYKSYYDWELMQKNLYKMKKNIEYRLKKLKKITSH